MLCVALPGSPSVSMALHGLMYASASLNPTWHVAHRQRGWWPARACVQAGDAVGRSGR
ncbi:hypothetical protein XHV734_4888 [Xanthomonas hortorum pv. vitians]|nr:hypothetical protein XHV734_4888 [Xanthomonas hortorum pv. vitians]